MKDDTLNGVRNRSSRDEQILRNIFTTFCGDYCFPSECCERCREKLAIEDACKALEEMRKENIDGDSDRKRD